MENKKSCKFWVVVLYMITCVVLIVLMMYLLVKQIKETDTYDDIKPNAELEVETELDKTYKILKEIEELYSRYYVNEEDTSTLEFNMANAMIQSFGDKYGLYLTPELAENESNAMNNILYGVGVLVRAEIHDGVSSMYVIDSYDGSSALEQGITRGCKIIEVGGRKLDFNTWSYDDVINEIKGDVGTSISIKFIDNNGNTLTKNIERRKLKIETIEYQILQDNIGYILIRDFERETDEDFRKALEYMHDNNVSKIIYDLRDNHGGLLETVVNMLDCLLPYMEFMYIQDSNNNIVDVFTSDDNMYGMTSVCIINGTTASASEFFVQTLKEYGNTTVIGEKSFGKGTVCDVLDLSNGGSLQISSYKYLTISKNCLEGIGVIPDIEMRLPDNKYNIQYKLDIEDDDIILKSIELLK